MLDIFWAHYYVRPGKMVGAARPVAVHAGEVVNELFEKCPSDKYSSN
jgi:hypothetical protein